MGERVAGGGEEVEENTVEGGDNDSIGGAEPDMMLVADGKGFETNFKYKLLSAREVFSEAMDAMQLEAEAKVGGYQSNNRLAALTATVAEASRRLIGNPLAPNNFVYPGFARIPQLSSDLTDAESREYILRIFGVDFYRPLPAVQTCWLAVIFTGDEVKDHCLGLALKYYPKQRSSTFVLEGCDSLGHELKVYRRVSDLCRALDKWGCGTGKYDTNNMANGEVTFQQQLETGKIDMVVPMQDSPVCGSAALLWVAETCCKFYGPGRQVDYADNTSLRKGLYATLTKKSTFEGAVNEVLSLFRGVATDGDRLGEACEGLLEHMATWDCAAWVKGTGIFPGTASASDTEHTSTLEQCIDEVRNCASSRSSQFTGGEFSSATEFFNFAFTSVTMSKKLAQQFRLDYLLPHDHLSYAATYWPVNTSTAKGEDEGATDEDEGVADDGKITTIQELAKQAAVHPNGKRLSCAACQALGSETCVNPAVCANPPNCLAVFVSGEKDEDGRYRAGSVPLGDEDLDLFGTTYVPVSRIITSPSHKVAVVTTSAKFSGAATADDTGARPLALERALVDDIDICSAYQEGNGKYEKYRLEGVFFMKREILRKAVENSDDRVLTIMPVPLPRLGSTSKFAQGAIGDTRRVLSSQQNGKKAGGGRPPAVSKHVVARIAGKVENTCYQNSVLQAVNCVLQVLQVAGEFSFSDYTEGISGECAEGADGVVDGEESENDGEGDDDTD